MSSLLTKIGSDSTDESSQESSLSYLKKDKKRPRDSPQKASNKLKKTRKNPISSSSSEETEPTEMTSNLNPTNFAELLRDEGVKKALQDIIRPTVEEAVQNSISNLSKRIDKIEASTTSQNAEIESINSRVDNLEQLARQNNIIVSGIQDKPGEHLLDNFKKFAMDYLMTNITENDIMSIFRLGKQKTDPTSPRPIMVKFNSPDKKTEIYKSRIHLRKMDIGKVKEYINPIYINEDLTPARASLFKSCRQAIKEKKLFSCWTFNGTIWVKTSKTGDPVRITNKKELAP